MGYKQPNNPMKMMKSALKMMKAEKKAGMHRDSAMYMNSPMYSGHSPMEMKYDSPAKKHCSPMHKEESRELKDMPIVDIEKGKAKGSPAKAAKPDYIDIDGDGDKNESMKKAAKDKKKGSPATHPAGSSGRKQAHEHPHGKGKLVYVDEKKESPANKYDKVVLGGNKGDKSKSKPGKKDYEK